ncbi:MAG: ABC transporter ATP-binding protein [Byssovorax sp.]
MSDGAVLRAEELVRRHGEVVAVAGASLAIAPGEPVALMGPSGCGKTSLLQMLGLLDRPSSGRVLLGEVDAWSLGGSGRAALRLAQIGFVFQQNNLFGHLSARENVALPAWRLGGDRQAALAEADRLLERFGLARRRDARAALLSTGESQRVAIARALINRPRLVLADEPTGSLDSVTAQAVLTALDEVCAAGSALLLVTHDAAVAARMRRTLRMRDGVLDG